MPHWEAHCQPVIQVSYQTNQHFSSKNTSRPRRRAGFTTSGARREEGREKMSEKKVCEQFWFSVMEILDQPHVLLSLSIQVSELAVSCQCLPAALWRLLAVMLLMFLTVTFVTALPRSSSLLLRLSLTLTSLQFPFPQPPVSLSHPSFLPTSQVQRWEVTTAVRQQPLVAVVIKGPGASLLSPVQVCITTYPTINNPCINTLSPRTRATPTALPIQLWVQQISSFSLSLDVPLSLLCCSHLLEYFSALSVSLITLSVWCPLAAVTIREALMHTANSLSPSPPPSLLLPFNLFPLSHTLFSQALIVYLTISSTLLPLLYIFLLPSLSPSFLCNLICFSFIHPLQRQCNERLIEVETLLDGFPCHYP